METLVVCKYDNDVYNIRKGNIYKIDLISTNDYYLYKNLVEKYKLTNFDLNLNHFEFVYNQVEFIDKLKRELSLNDEDILYYEDINNDYNYYIRYGYDILNMKLTTYNDIPCVSNINIISNNHMHEISINNYMTETGLTNIIKQIKFICGNDEGE